MGNSVELNTQFEERLIALELIDEPPEPERETMEEFELGELAMNIADVGLIKPLVVRPTGNRFQAIAGHRRLLACRIANYSPVPCRVKVNDQVDDLAILVSENAHTEAVNPIEEARFYQRVLTGLCGDDVDVLCQKVRRNRSYVEDRLNLLIGYPLVIEALQEKKIPLAVARELNKVRHPNQMLVLLDAAITQGATARTVMGWRKEYNADEDLQVIPVDSVGVPANGTAQIPGFQQLCFFCEDPNEPHLMDMVYMHRPCRRMVEKVLGREPQSNQAGVN